MQSTTPILALAAALAVAGCGGGGGSSGTGTLKLALTDAPACGFDAVHITVEKIRVHRSSSAGDADAGWSELTLAPARRIDLLSLTNGVLEELGQTQLPAGTYTQLRLVLAEGAGGGAPVHAVRPSGGAEVALETPSASQSGLKLNVDLRVEPDKVADFVLDFDACRSVVQRGGSARFHLKPVIAVIPRLSDAGQRVVGYVDPALVLPTTRISLQRNGVEQKATLPLAAPGPDLGKFVLYPVPAGDYTLVVSAEGRATAVMTGVPVTTGAVTFANAASAPIAPAASTMRTVAGTLAIGSSRADTDGVVAASQTLAGPLAVEVASQAVDADSGSYLLRLPTAAPLRAAYAASGVPSFAPAADVAGRYQVDATIPGVAPKTVAVDVGAANASADFVFP